MPWQRYTDQRRRAFEFSFEGLTTFTRQYEYSRLLCLKSQLVEDHDGGWFGPTTWHVETDFQSIRQMRDQYSATDVRTIMSMMRDDGSMALNRLIHMRSESELNRRRFYELMTKSSTQTAQSFDRRMHELQIAENGARGIRDVAFGSVVVGAGFLTGGSALGMLAFGSGLQGWAKYQDTSNLGSAVITATGTFIVGSVDISPSLVKASMTAGQRVAVVVVGAQLDALFETTGAFIEGKSVRNALQRGGARFVAHILSEFFIDSRALPVKVRLAIDTSKSLASDALIDRLDSREMSPRVSPGPQAEALSCCPAGLQGYTSDRQYVESLVLRYSR